MSCSCIATGGMWSALNVIARNTLHLTIKNAIKLHHIDNIAICHDTSNDGMRGQRSSSCVRYPEDSTAIYNTQTFTWVALIGGVFGISQSPITVPTISAEVTDHIISVDMQAGHNMHRTVCSYHTFIKWITATVRHPFVTLDYGCLPQDHKLHGRVAVGLWTGRCETCRRAARGPDFEI